MQQYITDTVCDIETRGGDAAFVIDQCGSPVVPAKWALDAITGQVLTIGYLNVVPAGSALVSEVNLEPCIDSGDEYDLLTRFWYRWSELSQARRRLIGWNFAGFDIPFIVRRSWILGVNIPAGVFHGRYLSDVVLDLMHVWSCYEYKKMAKLDLVARALGLGSKAAQEVTGATFAESFLCGDPVKREAAMHYAKLDLILTRDIYRRIVLGE